MGKIYRKSVFFQGEIHRKSVIFLFDTCDKPCAGWDVRLGTKKDGFQSENHLLHQ